VRTMAFEYISDETMAFRGLPIDRIGVGSFFYDVLTECATMI